MTKKKGPRKGTCPVCGRVFEKTPGNRVYCSEECSVVGHRRKAAEAHRKQRHAERGLKPITHICTVCGKEYTNCRKKSARCPEFLAAGLSTPSKHDRGLGIQKCIICGKEGVESALLVCRECLQKLLYEWARTCEPGHRKCLVCGKDFIPNSVEWDADYHIHVAGQLTCSIQCTDELYAGVLDKKKRRAHTRGD